MNRNFKPHTCLKIKGLCKKDWGSLSEYTRLRKLWLGRKRKSPRKYEEFLNEMPNSNREALEYLTRIYH
tara:strand:+ start:159 stop:365 length:207 start_codon:yes stop_codon:yes gene_type:complete